MSPTIYSTPKNRLPGATGTSDYTLKLGPRTVEGLLNKYSSFLSTIRKNAVRNPGVTQYQYFEENVYEYEYRTTYNPETNEIVTNDFRCPNYCHHHLGSTCSVCGQEG